MKIAIVGSGYVGLVTGACFAEMGTEVHAVDTDSAKIDRLKRGEIPIYEPGLEELVAKNVMEGRLSFTTSLEEVIDQVEIIFSAVGTPPNEDGSADLKYVLAVAHDVGRLMNDYKLVVTKSTVPVGTGAKIKAVIAEELARRGVEIDFDVASNPEFLKEGDAIKDFSHPDRVVVGVDSERARALMAQLYKPFTLNGRPILMMDIASAEMTKYAANSMLATRISFMNDIANLCERLGADVGMVQRGIATDPRIGDKFLHSGCGYGGSCFPKDVKALINTASQNGYRMRVLEAVEQVNASQKEVVFAKFRDYFNGRIDGLRVALWGLSFKPQTDDMREATSLVVVEQLLAAGCRVNAYDPVAMDEARRRLGNSITYSKDIYSAAEGADAIMLLTEWSTFRLPDWARLRNLVHTPLVIDGRNIYDRSLLQREGFVHIGIGTK